MICPSFINNRSDVKTEVLCKPHITFNRCTLITNLKSIVFTDQEIFPPVSGTCSADRKAEKRSECKSVSPSGMS